MTSKELVYNTLAFKNTERAPRQLWTLPWASFVYPDELKAIREEFPDDIVEVVPDFKQPYQVRKGNQYENGEYTDEWGCVFENIHRGIIGEVKKPIVQDEEWEDVTNVTIPYELLSFDIEEVNQKIRTEYKDKFTLAGCLLRPFEQLQFIRGTENLYMDLCYRPKKFLDFMQVMHGFYCELIEKWCKTGIDAIFIMDDWGSQKSLLISPAMWEELFMPLYRDYITIAKKYGKKAFMHSDGYTLDIIPKLIDIGLDAFNTQIFCMGADKLEKFKGKITFWGEVDRQHLLPNGSTEDIFNAVKSVYESLYQNGGCIAQCEFGAGAKPENVREVFNAWNKLTSKK